MLSMVKMLLKGEVGGHALNSHGNYIVDHGKSWKNHGIVFLNFCRNPDFEVYAKCSYDLWSIVFIVVFAALLCRHYICTWYDVQ